MSRLLRLRNEIQTYAWGSRTAIAGLLGAESPSAEPQAELWMGAHPKAPSHVGVGDAWVPLDAWIRRDPEGVLGPEVARRFGGELPYLMKLLAADQPLSIQAHPSAEQARAGFARENAAGIALDAPQRCYRDPHHKPELICAVTRFAALCGFRPADEIAAQLARAGSPALSALSAGFAERGDAEALRALFETLWTLREPERVRLVDEVRAGAAARESEDPACAWISRLGRAYPGDVGVLAPLLLNLVELAPGEALFLPAGRLHSYLEGVGIELMASSDNVLRGGLTPKHVDVPELLATLRFDLGRERVLRPVPVGSGVTAYESPAREFALAVLEPAPGRDCEAADRRGVEIFFCARGEATLVDVARGESLPLRRGESALVTGGISRLRVAGMATLYRAGVPVGRPC
jgi:mannose-6-phosphate isomerase